MVYWLKYQGSRIALSQGETVVGRSPYCSVVVNSRRVSRQHCVLNLSRDLLTVTDLGSSNGTWVNGQAVTKPTRIFSGDLVELVDEALEVLDGSPKVARDARDTQKDLPMYQRDADEDADQTTITQAQTASVALIEALVANGSGARAPNQHFRKVRRAVEKYLKGDGRVRSSSGRLELQRLQRSIEATARLDGSPEATAWRHRILAQLHDGGGVEPRPQG